MREEFEKDLYPRSSRSASGELLPLDKDLSWKSASRTFGLHGEKQVSEYPVYQDLR